MSDATQQQKVANKAKGLGRGLGSLLGSTNDGAFAKSMTPQREVTVEKIAVELASKSPLTNVQDFIEKPEPDQSREPEPSAPNALRIWNIPIEKLQRNPRQPRQNFEKEPLQELAQSIQEKGIIQPILVRKISPDLFEIIAGERRWRAAQIAGLKEVPSIIKESADQEVLELALIENIQRENLNVIEEAEAYDFLMQKYNLTQQDLAQKVGKDRATVANVLRLLQLDPTVRQMVTDRQISLGQAKVLLSITDHKLQKQIALRARGESLSVRALEKLVAKAKVTVIAPSDEHTDLRRLMAGELGVELQKLIGSRVVLDYADGKGKVSIHFYSDAELNQFADRLRASWKQN